MNSFPQYIVKLWESSEKGCWTDSQFTNQSWLLVAFLILMYCSYQIMCMALFNRYPIIQSKSQVEAQETQEADYAGGPCSDVEERWRQFSFHEAGAGIVIYFLDGDRWAVRAVGGAAGGVTGSCPGTRGRSPARTSPSTPSPGGYWPKGWLKCKPVSHCHRQLGYWSRSPAAFFLSTCLAPSSQTKSPHKFPNGFGSYLHYLRRSHNWSHCMNA